VVAYRAHSNPHFPMFARWDAGEKVFKTFRIAQRGLDGYTLTDKGVLKAL
jgi:hypothetical protein